MDRPLPAGQSMGPSVDRQGAPVIDPTENVKALSEAANKRQDDLRQKDKEISDIKHDHMKDMSALRAAHAATVGMMRETYQEKMLSKESDRIDSIRQVDREEVAKTAVGANTAIMTLAKQTTDLQQTLAKQVADTAAAQEARYTTQTNETNKRLSALELAASEGKGKQTVVDPQIAELKALVEVMARNQSVGAGRDAANKDYTGYIIAAIGILFAIASYLRP